MTPDPEAIRDLWEVDFEQEDLPDALDEAGVRPLGAATARGLYPDVDAPAETVYQWRQIPLLREWLIILLSGGYDRVDIGALVAASAARPEVAG